MTDELPENYKKVAQAARDALFYANKRYEELCDQPPTYPERMQIMMQLAGVAMTYLKTNIDLGSSEDPRKAWAAVLEAIIAQAEEASEITRARVEVLQRAAAKAEETS